MSEMNDDMLDMLMEDVEAEETGLNLSEDDMNNVAKLANEMIRLEDLVELLTEKLKDAEKSLRMVSEVGLPEAMMQSGMKSMELDNGFKLSRSTKYIGNITKSNEEAAFEWFKENGREGVVSSVVSIDMGKGKMEEAENTAEKISGLGFEPNLKYSVHWQTLRGVVRELYETGEKIPDCIGTHVIEQAKIKRK